MDFYAIFKTSSIVVNKQIIFEFSLVSIKYIPIRHRSKTNLLSPPHYLTQSAGALEWTDWISVEGQ